MAAEGTPLRFYQNIPVPGQVLFQLKQGFGDGIPWTLPGARDVKYDIEEFPVTLDVLENTRCIGDNGTSGPNYFLNKETMNRYIESFQKIWENLDGIVKYIETMPYKVPWSNFAPSTRGIWTIVTPEDTK